MKEKKTIKRKSGRSEMEGVRIYKKTFDRVKKHVSKTGQTIVGFISITLDKELDNFNKID